jgi:hypothetical protein
MLMKQLIFTLISILVFSFSAFAQAEVCPKIEVTGGGVVQPEAPMNFSVVLKSEVELSAFKYKWKISAGTITKGQNSSSITVDTTGLADGTAVTATVEIKGLPENCLNTASESGAVYGIVDIFPLIDEFGNLPRNEMRARIDAFFLTLGSSPKDQAYIVNYGTDKEVSAREKLIRNHIALRKYDATRIIFVREGATPKEVSGIWTRFYILPPGMELPSSR